MTERELLTPAARRLQQIFPEVREDDFAAWARAVDPSAIASFAANRLLGGFEIANALENIRCRARLLAGEASLGSVVWDSDIDFFLSRVRRVTAERLIGVGHNFLTSRASTLVNHIAVLVDAGEE